MDFSKYQNQIEFPERPKRPNRKAGPAAHDKWEIDRAEYLEQVGMYREEGRRLVDLFKQDAFEGLGISKNPKREKMYDIAWEAGHSAGLSEVWWHMVELAELIKE